MRFKPTRTHPGPVNTNMAPGNMELAPLRQWDDFLPGAERFSKPDMTDLTKWNNRVISNLLYYQTNYFVVVTVVFFIVGYVQ